MLKKSKQRFKKWEISNHRQQFLPPIHHLEIPIPPSIMKLYMIQCSIIWLTWKYWNKYFLLKMIFNSYKIWINQKMKSHEMIKQNQKSCHLEKTSIKEKKKFINVHICPIHYGNLCNICGIHGYKDTFFILSIWIKLWRVKDWRNRNIGRLNKLTFSSCIL
jgi:hypothetical protein